MTYGRFLGQLVACAACTGVLGALIGWPALLLGLPVAVALGLRAGQQISNRWP